MEHRPAIFKLNLDCFDRIFDYLSLDDLGQFSQTCKAMKTAVGEYYEANYGTIQRDAVLKMEDLHLDTYTMGYSDFVQKLWIHPNRLDKPNGVKRDLIRKAMELTIGPARFTKPDLRRLEYILNNAEVLNILCWPFWGMNESIYEMVPSMCYSLKRLHMNDFECDKAAQTRNNWLLREYPTLKHLEWTQSPNHGYKINGIKEFFERNPNVRSFATDNQCLCESQPLIIESGLKLDDLTIDVNCYDPKIIKDFCILLNELHEKGVYKRLHLKFTVQYGSDEKNVIQQIIDQIIPINSIRSMCLERGFNVNWSNLVNLVELRITYGGLLISNFDMMARQLVNLERVNIRYIFLEEMEEFIYHSVKLKKIRVERLDDGNVSALDLVNMNKRREDLLDARKVTIFVDEEVYLATKWASIITDFRLIEMRRNTAHKWGHHFGPY